MDLKQIVVLMLQVSVLSIVFGFGLKATLDDLLYVVRRPGLLARSILAVFVIMPVVAVMLARLFNFAPTVRIVLVALAVSPSTHPAEETIESGQRHAFRTWSIATLALLSIVAVPAAVELLGRFLGRQLEPASATIARVVLISTLVPLAAGVIVRAALPAVADRLEKVVTLLGTVLLLLGVLALVAAALPEMWALIGNGNVLGIVIFTVVGLAIGHILGGRIRTIPPCSRSRRHAAIRRSLCRSRRQTFPTSASPPRLCSI